LKDKKPKRKDEKRTGEKHKDKETSDKKGDRKKKKKKKHGRLKRKASVDEFDNPDEPRNKSEDEEVTSDHKKRRIDDEIFEPGNEDKPTTNTEIP